MGQMVAPLLERMGATKAIPLATGSESQQSSIPTSSTASSQPIAASSQQSQEMTLASIQPWGEYPLKPVLIHLEQITNTIKSEREQLIIKLCY